MIIVIKLLYLHCTKAAKPQNICSKKQIRWGLGAAHRNIKPNYPKIFRCSAPYVPIDHILHTSSVLCTFINIIVYFIHKKRYKV